MTKRVSPLNVYWSEQLKMSFEELRESVTKHHGLRLSRSQLAEVAIQQFTDKYSKNSVQLVLELNMVDN